MRRTQKLSKSLTALTAITLLLVACSSSDSSADTFAAVEAEAPASGAEPTDVAAEDVAQAAEGAESNRGALAAQELGRSIIFRADMVVAVTDVQRATDEAVRLIEQRGGILFGQQSVGLPEPASTLTFRIAPEDFQAAIADLATLGEVRVQNVSADDVTERVVDLESRIATAETSVDRLRSLIEEAGDLEAITQLENQLLERETLLETLRGQLRTIRDQVDLATITVTLTEALARPAISLQVTAYPGHDDAGASCPGDSQLAVEEKAPATVCFEITNTGDTSLTDFEVRDPVLDLEMGDLLQVFGDPSDTLEPGEFIILAAEINPERTLRSQSRATATPVNQEGEPLESRSVSSTTSALVQAVDPGGLPGFGDGLSASWDVLLTLRDVIVLLAGLAVPFLWVPLALWLYIRWRRTKAATPPAVPAPVAPPVGASSTEDDGESED